MFTILFHLLAYTTLTTAWLPPKPIRGVNLGSLFVLEPWMLPRTWHAMSCSSTASEWDCVEHLGQAKANAAFQKHWGSFITDVDFDEMKIYGLNTVRIPVGHWLVEETIIPGEQWPRGGMVFLDRLVEWAAVRDMHVIIDLHAAPGAQVSNNSFVGRKTPAHFFHPRNYARAYTFLRNLTHRIHTHPSYRSSGTLGLLNEPDRHHPSLAKSFYPAAYATVRAVEAALSVPQRRALTLALQSSAWGSGNPVASLPASATRVVFDEHRYLAYSDIQATRTAYMAASCKDSFSTDTFVGECSLAVRRDVEWDDAWSPTKEENHVFYRKWWAAQVKAYERGRGWVFWSWKTELEGDWRWSYRAAVGAGVVPRDVARTRVWDGCA